MKRIPDAMIERLANIERRLEAMTDTGDSSCSLPDGVKDGARPFVDTWVEPDVKALLAWARGTHTASEVERWFPTSRAHARIPRKKS